MKLAYSSLTFLCTIGFLSLLAVPCAGTGITLDQLNQAIPERASDSSCESVSTPTECATNSRAVAAINNAITKYGVIQRGEIVALVSLMAYESGKWQYNTNHYPGRAGQGTRAMLMFNFIQEYATQLHGSSASTILAAGAVTDQVMNNVRALVLDDNDSFGSAFWYLVSKAAQYHNSSSRLRDGDANDFQDYVVNGVGAGWDSERLTIWQAVNRALSS